MQKKWSLIWVILFLLEYTGIAQEDISLYGQVVEQNSQFSTGQVKYLSNVSIQSPGATPTTSDINGRFKLVFTDQPLGKIAFVQAAKQGFEVVNKEELRKAAVLGRSGPLKIVMCAEGRLYENQITYYQIARDAVLKEYKQRLATLYQKGKQQEELMKEMESAFNQQISSAEEALRILENERTNAELQARELADKFLTVNLDDQSQSYQQAFSAFIEGHLDHALGILDSVNLAERLAFNIQERQKESALIDTLSHSIQKRENQIKQDVKQCLLKADLHKLALEWKKAEESYELAIQYDSLNYDIQFEYCDYLISQNQFTKALQLAEQIVKKLEYLTEKSPGIHTPNLAEGLSFLGRANMELKDFQQADVAYQKALDLFVGLNQQDQTAYGEQIAVLCNNMGSSLVDQKQPAKALPYFQQSNAIYGHFASLNPSRYLHFYGVGLQNIGGIYYSLADIHFAIEYFEKALYIRRKAVEQGASSMEEYLANTLDFLAKCYHKLNHIPQATGYLTEALDIRRNLSRSNPDVFLPKLAQSLELKGILLTHPDTLANGLPDFSGFEEGKKAFEEAIAIFRGAAAKFPSVYLPDLGRCLNNGGARLSREDSELGRDWLEEAKVLRLSLANENTQVYGLDACQSLLVLVYLYDEDPLLTDSHRETVLTYLHKTDSILALCPDSPLTPSYQNSVNEYLAYYDVTEKQKRVEKLAEKIDKSNNLNETIELYKELINVLGLWRDVDWDNPDLKTYHSVQMGNLSYHLLFAKRFEEAVKQGYMAHLYDPSQDWVYSNIAVGLLLQGKYGKAFSYYEEWKGKPFDEEMSWTEAFLSDLDDLEAVGITHPDVEKIRTFLRE